MYFHSPLVITWCGKYFEPLIFLKFKILISTNYFCFLFYLKSTVFSFRFLCVCLLLNLWEARGGVVGRWAQCFTSRSLEIYKKIYAFSFFKVFSFPFSRHQVSVTRTQPGGWFVMFLVELRYSCSVYHCCFFSQIFSVQ